MSTGRSFSPGPTSIKIFLADGDPDGLLIVDMTNWTGRALVVSRTQLEKLLLRPEIEQPGVYVLTGPGESNQPRLYIGEANDLKVRLLRRDHKRREFWTRIIAFVASDESMNKASIGYLEARLIGLARNANQWEVENDTAPALPPLSEPERAAAEEFLARMLLIYPLLGVDAFEAAAQGAQTSRATEERFLLRQRGSEAFGIEDAPGFAVLKGSLARAETTPSAEPSIIQLRESLLERGVLRLNGGHLEFTQNYRFSSPSQASSVLVGGASNGRIAWTSERTGQTLKAIQESRA